MVGASVHRHFDRLRHLFPGARYVHIVRDPRDVARSWIDFGWQGNGWACGRAWAELEALWDRVKTEIPPNAPTSCASRTWSASRARSSRALCAFLGVAYAD